MDDEVHLSDDLSHYLGFYSQRANSFYRSLLVDGPELRCKVGHPDRWFHEPPLRWQAIDRPTGEWVDIDSLSSAQRRWARIAARLGLDAMDIENRAAGAVGIVLLDEPEQALHVLAERHLANGLNWVAEYVGTAAIVASHSRELLNRRDVNILRVHRDAGGLVAVDPLDANLREALGPKALGLEFADLAQYYRVFMAVEGSHDEAVITSLIADRLSASAVDVVTLEGSHALDATSADFVLNFTNAALLIVLDRIGGSGLIDLWSRVSESDEPDLFKRKLSVYLDDPTEEIRKAAGFCMKAVSRGVSDRVHLFGFKEPDIINYLPEQSFVPEAKSWESLLLEWRKLPSPRKRFKDWLRASKGARINQERLGRIALSLKLIPPEFGKLAELCEQLANSKT